MKKLILALFTLAVMTACSGGQQQKALVLYYSQTGVTKAVAEEIQRQTGADIASFDVTEPYSGDFNQTIQRCMQENAQAGEYSIPLADLDVDPSKYDVIYLGYPIWFGTYASPVKALLLKKEWFAGKTVIPFATFGSGGLIESTRDLKAALPDSKILDGYGVRTARAEAVPAEVERFLIESGLKEGKVDALPAYSEEKPVTEEEIAIFNAACSSYQMPLGTPVSAGSRKTPTGTDYIFTAENASAQSKIYVTVQDGKTPEFTRVDR